MHLGQLVLLT